MINNPLLKKGLTREALTGGFLKVMVAYSGGLDSHVLLHLLSECKKNNPDIDVQAIHVNHQLNPLSDAWAMHCQKICDALTIPLIIEKISMACHPGDSLEENARNARYAALKQYIDKNSVLLTAHHLNDQAETFLLQALRGAGLKGLSAMPVEKKFGKGILRRPLLSFSREQLECYARNHRLQWIEDDSNQDPRFRRNYLRHIVFPPLKKNWPAVLENFSRSARVLAEQEKVIAEIAAIDYAFCREDQNRLSRQRLLSLSLARQRLVLREWFRDNQLRMPNEKHIKHIQRDVLHAAPDAKPLFSLEKVAIRRDRLFLCITNSKEVGAQATT